MNVWHLLKNDWHFEVNKAWFKSKNYVVCCFHANIVAPSVVVNHGFHFASMSFDELKIVWDRWRFAHWYHFLIFSLIVFLHIISPHGCRLVNNHHIHGVLCFKLWVYYMCEIHFSNLQWESSISFSTSLFTLRACV